MGYTWGWRGVNQGDEKYAVEERRSANVYLDF